MVVHNRLNKLNDEELERANFTREEIVYVNLKVGHHFS
ncbi:DUF6483 family protein [Anaerosalibacter bizertensis]